MKNPKSYKRKSLFEWHSMKLIRFVRKLSSHHRFLIYYSIYSNLQTSVSSYVNVECLLYRVVVNPMRKGKYVESYLAIADYFVTVRCHH